MGAKKNNNALKGNPAAKQDWKGFNAQQKKDFLKKHKDTLPEDPPTQMKAFVSEAAAFYS